MAIDSLNVQENEIKLFGIEDYYFTTGAEYLLSIKFEKNNPSREDVFKVKEYLLNNYLGLSIILSPSLTELEIELLHYLSCNKKLKEVAVLLNTSIDIVKKNYSYIFKKLRTDNSKTALYRATLLGYLPIENPVFFKF